jgi:hypothetical protein
MHNGYRLFHNSYCSLDRDLVVDWRTVLKQNKEKAYECLSRSQVVQDRRQWRALFNTEKKPWVQKMWGI